MTWKMHIEFTFFLPGRGRVVIGRPEGAPENGPVIVEAHGETHQAEVVGIERFYRGDHKGENCGLLLRGADGSDLAGSWDVAEGEIRSACQCSDPYYHSVTCPVPPEPRP